MRLRYLAAVVLCLSAASGAASAADTSSPTAAANGFYGEYAGFHPSDGIPDAKGRAKFEPFISPALDKLLADGEAANDHFAKVTKNMSPPLIEGDLFTSNFEGATAFHVEACITSGQTAHCPVNFGYRTNAKEDAKPVNWTDTVYLVRTTNGWRVDDIGYGATWSFGNKGRLKETLQNAIRDGNSATPQ
jgi:hypothetical protein